LLAYTLLHEENRSAWQRWFTAAGLAEAPPGRAQIFHRGQSGACRRRCAATASRWSIAPSRPRTSPKAASCNPSTSRSSYGAYWLVARDFKRLSPEARAFREWLLRRFAVLWFLK
jgi:LysR family glycine cleavage system transcriptional activator